MSAKQDKVTEGGSFVDSVKMVVTVTLVAAISAGLLGLVYAQTKGPIAESQKKEKRDALGYILPAFDNQPYDECLAEGDARPALCAQGIFTARKGDEVVGYAISKSAKDGFGPYIDMLVGATPDGRVTGVYILGHQETPGLGAKATVGQENWKAWRESAPNTGNDPFLRQFALRKIGDPEFSLKVKKDGGDIDAITASTITSRAIANAVVDAAKEILAKTGGGAN